MKNKTKSGLGTETGVRMLQEKLAKRNVPVTVSSMEEVELFIDKDGTKVLIGKQDLSAYSFIFFRRVGEKRNLACIISSIAKKKGIDFIDRLYIKGNDPGKLKQMFSLAEKGVSIPKTYFSSRYDEYAMGQAEKFLGLPMVVKISESRKGLGVFLAKTKGEVMDIIKSNPDEEIFLQEFIPNDFDYRVLVLGEKVACVIKRERPEKTSEFRNNVYLGAAEKFLELSEVESSIKDTAIAAAKTTNIQVAGVDVVIDSKNNPYIFEVNRAPAFTYDEELSNETSSLAEYLYECYQEKK